MVPKRTWITKSIWRMYMIYTMKWSDFYKMKSRRSRITSERNKREWNKKKEKSCVIKTFFASKIVTFLFYCCSSFSISSFTISTCTCTCTCTSSFFFFFLLKILYPFLQAFSLYKTLNEMNNCQGKIDIKTFPLLFLISWNETAGNRFFKKV